MKADKRIATRLMRVGLVARLSYYKKQGYWSRHGTTPNALAAGDEVETTNKTSRRRFE